MKLLSVMVIYACPVIRSLIIIEGMTMRPNPKNRMPITPTTCKNMGFQRLDDGWAIIMKAIATNAAQPRVRRNVLQTE